MRDQTIVVGWMPGPYGAAAVTHALREAGLRGHRILVVNATRGDAYVDQRFAVEEQRATLEAELEASGVAHEIRQPVGGDVADQVLEVAAEVGASLVVIGLRRRSPVGKLVLGSVAQRILLGASCPVLAVKPAADD
jgi:nucleotide-binding universal stress UspA family protein